MDLLAWLTRSALTLLGVVWNVLWFLVSGWVSTLLQITLLVAAIYFFKYGWRRAPAEIWNRSRSFARFFWNWLRARELPSRSAEVHEIVRVMRAKEFGDINISTVLSLLTLVGLALLTTL